MIYNYKLKLVHKRYLATLKLRVNITKTYSYYINVSTSPYTSQSKTDKTCHISCYNNKILMQKNEDTLFE